MFFKLTFMLNKKLFSVLTLFIHKFRFVSFMQFSNSIQVKKNELLDVQKSIVSIQWIIFRIIAVNIYVLDFSISKLVSQKIIMVEANIYYSNKEVVIDIRAMNNARLHKISQFAN